MTDPSPVVAELVARCVSLADSDGPAAVGRVLDEHPDLAPQVRERLAALASLGLLEGRADREPARRLGPFRLLGRLGGGGMGEVHLARQDGLERDVALKLVRPDHLPFSAARTRFRREAEAVARLKHPGIVPVYTVGEQDGVPYLAMECVEGATLEEALASVAGRDPASLTGRDLQRAVEAAVERLAVTCQRPVSGSSAGGSSAHGRSLFAGSWVEAVLRIGVAVSDALQHAHDQGVLHRDVKPSNLMLTLDGRVLLLDFGLALRADGERLTRTGAVVGSLAYMPPEQVRGEVGSLDGRVDVYALGATLYELLALRPPFVAADSESLRQAILGGGAPSVRGANPSVGRDAATLLSVALGSRPADRYATPAELGAELQRVLERRPLLARPPSLLVRGGRWIQRRPAAAAALALATLLLVGGPLAYALVAQRHADDMESVAKLARAAAAEAQRESAAAQVARRETERHYELARQALDELLVDVTTNELFEQPGLLDTRRRLLGRAVSFFDSLLDVRPGDRELLLDRLEVLDELAFVDRLAGRLEAADQGFRQLMVQLDALSSAGGAGDAGGERRVFRLRTAALAGLTVVRELLGDEVAMRLHEDALVEHLERGAAADPGAFDVRRELGRVLGVRARRRGMVGDLDGAREGFGRALAVFDELLDERPEDGKSLSMRLDVSCEWTGTLARARRWSDCVQVGLDGLPGFDRLEALGEVELPDRKARLEIWSQLGRSLAWLGAFEDGERLLEAAESEARLLMRDHPGYYEQGLMLANVLVGRSELALQRGVPEQALAFMQAAEQVYREGAARWPASVELPFACVESLNQQSKLLREELGRLDDARAVLNDAIARLGPLRGRLPIDRWSASADRLWHALTLVELERGDHAGSLAAATLLADLDHGSGWEPARRVALLATRNLPLVDADGALSVEQRGETRQAAVDLALAQLELSVERGLADPGPIRDDPRWWPLVGEARYQALIEELQGR